MTPVAMNPRRIVHVTLLSFVIFTIFSVPAVIQQININRLWDMREPVGATLRWTLASYWVYAAMAVPVFFLSMKIEISRRRLWLPVLLHLALFGAMIAVFSLVHPVELSLLGLHSKDAADFLSVFSSSVKTMIVQWIWMYVLIVLAARTAHYYAGLKDRETRESQLREQLARTELEVLKLQLHPHFIFNSLTGISALMTTDVARARTLIAELSDLLRAALTRSASEEIRLADELNFVRAYVSLQQMRMGERLTFREEIGSGMDEIAVPSMILQPLIENAIKHGVEMSREGGEVELKIAQQEGRLVIDVMNDAHEASAAWGGQESSGVGLANVRARLKSLHGEAQVVTLSTACEGAKVVAHIEMPARSFRRDA